MDYLVVNDWKGRRETFPPRAVTREREDDGESGQGGIEDRDDGLHVDIGDPAGLLQ